MSLTDTADAAPAPGIGAGVRPSVLLDRTLLAVARQRSGLDESRCRLVLDFLHTGSAVRGALHVALATVGLSELKFSILVVLWVLDPTPATSADLSMHAGVTRSSITEALDGLQDHLFIKRERGTTDRRMIYVHLTDAGREAADAALVVYLRTTARVARFIGPSAQTGVSELCAQLRSGAV